MKKTHQKQKTKKVKFNPKEETFEDKIIEQPKLDVSEILTKDDIEKCRVAFMAFDFKDRKMLGIVEVRRLLEGTFLYFPLIHIRKIWVSTRLMNRSIR